MMEYAIFIAMVIVTIGFCVVVAHRAKEKAKEKRSASAKGD
jgi:hypothetical protein